MNDGTDAWPYIAVILWVYFLAFLLALGLAVISYVALGLTLSRLFGRQLGRAGNLPSVGLVLPSRP